MARSLSLVPVLLLVLVLVATASALADDKPYPIANAFAGAKVGDWCHLSGSRNKLVIDRGFGRPQVRGGQSYECVVLLTIAKASDTIALALTVCAIEDREDPGPRDTPRVLKRLRSETLTFARAKGPTLDQLLRPIVGVERVAPHSPTDAPPSPVKLWNPAGAHLKDYTFPSKRVAFGAAFEEGAGAGVLLVTADVPAGGIVHLEAKAGSDAAEQGSVTLGLDLEGYGPAGGVTLGREPLPFGPPRK